jgi:hypothetical protein
MRRDRPEPLALPGVLAKLVDIIDGQRACERDPHLGSLRVDNAGSDLLAWNRSSW